MTFLLPLLVVALPILAIVLLAVAGKRRLSGSCGGVGADGSCVRCGKPATDVDKLRAEGQSCP